VGNEILIINLAWDSKPFKNKASISFLVGLRCPYMPEIIHRALEFKLGHYIT
jgi:hypothetical protein